MIMNKNHFYLQIADDSKRYIGELNRTYFRDYMEFSNVFIFQNKYINNLNAVFHPEIFALGRLIFIDLTDDIIVAEVLDTSISKLVIKENETYIAHLLPYKTKDGTIKLHSRIGIDIAEHNEENAG